MPHVPNFPTPTDGDDDENDSGSSPNRRGIIDRIIDDGNWPSPTGD
ncbi:hypothetical protein [Natrialba aegyptia]|nr:hypothetical protein [Natrialba aegyptia]